MQGLLSVDCLVIVGQPPYKDKTAYTNHLKSNTDTPENAMNREIQVFNLLKSEGVSFIEST